MKPRKVGIKLHLFFSCLVVCLHYYCDKFAELYDTGACAIFKDMGIIIFIYKSRAVAGKAREAV